MLQVSEQKEEWENSTENKSFSLCVHVCVIGKKKSYVLWDNSWHDNTHQTGLLVSLLRASADLL